MKELFHNKWLSIFDKDGYIFSHETRCNGKIVAVLAYKDDQILGRYERCLSHSENVELCAITGGMDEEDETIHQTVIKELKEEAGIDATSDELIPLGTVRPSKSADTTVYLYAIDCENKSLGEAKGDGSSGEQGSYVEWISVDEAIACKDPLVHAMLCRLTRVNEEEKVGK